MTRLCVALPIEQSVQPRIAQPLLVLEEQCDAEEPRQLVDSSPPHPFVKEPACALCKLLGAKPDSLCLYDHHVVCKLHLHHHSLLSLALRNYAETSTRANEVAVLGYLADDLHKLSHHSCPVCLYAWLCFNCDYPSPVWNMLRKIHKVVKKPHLRP